MNYEKKDFVVEESTRKDKKYMAHLKNDPSKKIHFGQIKPNGTPYEQYKDQTPLQLYSKYNHNDTKRKDLYFKRHRNDIKRGFNAAWLSFKFLW